MLKEALQVWAINAILIATLVALIGAVLKSPPSAYAAGGGWDTDGVMGITCSENERLILVNTDPHDKVGGQEILLYRAEGAGTSLPAWSERAVSNMMSNWSDTAADSATERRYLEGVTFKQVYDDYKRAMSK